MSDGTPGWKPLLELRPPEGCTLHAALLTTYDRADERLLAEHLLPSLLGIDRDPAGEGAERECFVVELNDKLKHLHDAIAVVSSVARDEPVGIDTPDAPTYPWLWRSVRRLTVGRRDHAIQHAKLWLLHWSGHDSDEWLDVVISSANLTMAAAKGQVQAVWKTRLKLHPREAKSRLSDWGLLAPFIRELLRSCGDEARAQVYEQLLSRADCPEGVHFVASVPGRHSPGVLRKTPWGSAGLSAAAPAGRGRVSAWVLCPYVGEWQPDALLAWCDEFEGSADRTHLVWIEKNHPWAREQRWMLPQASLAAMRSANVRLLQWQYEPDVSNTTNTFHSSHRADDPRWSHAKVYAFRRGSSRRLLITSANFSPSAWGRRTADGTLVIENFELGVCVEQAQWPFDQLDEFPEGVEPATVLRPMMRATPGISWATAAWDGQTVSVECRSLFEGAPQGVVMGKAIHALLHDWQWLDTESIWRASGPWAANDDIPQSVCLTSGDAELRVPVFDARDSNARADYVPLEIDPDRAELLRDLLLFEQYGGAAWEEGNSGATGATGALNGDGTANGDSYSVPAFEAARRHFVVVDRWVKEAGEKHLGPGERRHRDRVMRDGAALRAAFQRQSQRDEMARAHAGIGARLAAEELGLRLDAWERP